MRIAGGWIGRLVGFWIVRTAQVASDMIHAQMTWHTRSALLGEMLAMLACTERIT